MTRKAARPQRKKPAPPPAPEGYTARSKSQATALDIIARSTITFVLGPAGTGKTHLSSGYAVQKLLAGEIESIVICRPSVATEEIGYLPGNAEEKVAPYLVPFFDALERIAGRQGTQRDLVAKAVKIAPLAYLRGRTFRRSVMILDEAQNTTYAQLKLFMTRIGAGSQVIINGDTDQSDLAMTAQRLEEVADRLKAVHGVSVFRFTDADIVRHQIIGPILRGLAK